MNKISDFLSRFNLFVSTETTVAKTVQSVIVDVLNITIDHSHIAYQSGVVRVSTYATVRSMIKINEAKIRSMCNERLKHYSITVTSIQ
jgi:hypothetical protein